MKEDITKLLNQIFILAKYNEQNKGYQLSKEAYKILGFNQHQRKIIQELCQEYGIVLEYPYKPLPQIKGQELFNDYNNLKDKLKENLNSSELEKLEQRRIKIRNKIAEYNMELIRVIIDRRLNGNYIELLDNNTSIEDLYQYGYEALIKYLDTNYLEPEKIKKEISLLLMLQIQEILCQEYGISPNTMNELANIKNILEISTEFISVEQLSNQVDILEERVINLLTLNSIINPTNIDEFNSKELLSTKDVPEDIIIKKINQEQISKLIKTIQGDIQQKVITLLWGFDGEIAHTYEEISNELGDTVGTIDIKRKKALIQLKHPVRIKYIKEIFNLPTSSDVKDKTLTELIETKDNTVKKLELFLLRQLDKNELMYLIDKLNYRFKVALLIHLDYEEVLENNQKNYDNYQSEKEIALNYLRERITTLYVTNSSNIEIQNYLDYLMYNYLNKPKVKTKINI